MGLISSMETRSRLENPAVPITSESVLQYLGLEPSAAGTRVNTTEKALGLTAFWAGVRIISQTIASLPLGAYERLEKGRRPAREHRINQLLAIRPNRRMTPFTFKELRAVHLLTHGNSYAEIDRDGAGRIIGLWPLLPDRTGVELVNGEKCYYTEIGGKRIRLEPDRVLHVPGMGFDGLRGYSVI
ncbi:MAG: phage portal protein, partial [Dehalococcoidales bacterium]